MKFRESFQVFRSDSREDGGRPSTASYFKFPGIKEKQSVTTLSNGTEDKQPQEQPPQQAGAKNTPTRKAMQDFLQKTGASLKSTGATLRAKGAKFEKRIPRKKAKVVGTSAWMASLCGQFTLTSTRPNPPPSATAPATASKYGPSISIKRR